MPLKGRILTISAHPDDWELGCAGTIERLKREGCDVAHAVLSGGRGDRIDNEFDSDTLLTRIQSVEYFIETHKPDIILTHYAHDLNIDHRITYQAVITAARPLPDHCVKEIYSFEVLSSTEWSDIPFKPDMFVALTLDDMETKEKILRDGYDSEMRDIPHARSYQAVESLAMVRGMTVGEKYAEAFKTIRRII